MNMAFGAGALARPVAAAAACILLSASADSRFDAASERIRRAFVSAEGSFQCERATKRLEIARRLEGPRFSAVPTQEDELAAFGAYFDEEISLWRSFPLNPDVSPRRLSVADFGAEGDGVADDAPAFASAIAAVKALNGEPAVLEVPAGTYFLKDCGLANCASSAHVVLSGCTNLVLSGASPETTHFVLGDDMKPGIDVVDSCNVSVRNIDVYWKKTPFESPRPLIE